MTSDRMCVELRLRFVTVGLSGRHLHTLGITGGQFLQQMLHANRSATLLTRGKPAAPWPKSMIGFPAGASFGRALVGAM